jgi:hypothetical protein
MKTQFHKMTPEDQEIWKLILQKTNLWSLYLMAKDHYSDDEIFRSSMNEHPDFEEMTL